MPLSPRNRAASLLLPGYALVMLLCAGRPALAACGDGILDPGEQCDDANLLNGDTRSARQTRITVINEIGSVLVDTGQADVLLVPTAESLTAPPPPPGENSVDHYKCYRAKTSLGTGHFVAACVSVKDEFATTGKLFDLRRPRHLCSPVADDGREIRNLDAHLLCYQAKPAPGEPKFVPVDRVLTSNELAVSVLRVVREAELCVPSITNRTTGARS